MASIPIIIARKKNIFSAIYIPAKNVIVAPALMKIIPMFQRIVKPSKLPTNSMKYILIADANAIPTFVEIINSVMTGIMIVRIAVNKILDKCFFSSSPIMI
jgi:hypothetical protein